VTLSELWLLDSKEQLIWRHAQRPRDADNVLQAYIPLPPLDASHVRPVKTRFVGEGFLGHILCQSKLSNALAKQLFWVTLHVLIIIA
jgi:hypothetical protein